MKKSQSNLINDTKKGPSFEEELDNFFLDPNAKEAEEEEKANLCEINSYGWLLKN